MSIALVTNRRAFPYSLLIISSKFSQSKRAKSSSVWNSFMNLGVSCLLISIPLTTNCPSCVIPWYCLSTSIFLLASKGSRTRNSKSCSIEIGRPVSLRSMLTIFSYRSMDFILLGFLMKTGSASTYNNSYPDFWIISFVFISTSLDNLYFLKKTHTAIPIPNGAGCTLP